MRRVIIIDLDHMIELVITPGRVVVRDYVPRKEEEEE